MSTAQTNNPILDDYSIPAFDIITAEDFHDAIDTRIVQARAVITEIAQNHSAPNFENTVMALDIAFKNIRRISSLLEHYTGALATPKMMDANEYTSSAIEAFKAEVFQNPAIAARFKALQAPKAPEDARLFDVFRLEFESYGAFLSGDKQQRIKAIDAELIALATQFSKNLSNDSSNRSVLITDEAELAGIQDADKAAFKANAKDARKQGWLIIPERFLVDDLLGQASHPAFREKLYTVFKALASEVPYCNESVIQDMQRLRHARADLLGYESHAAYATARMMPSDTAQIQEWLATIGKGACGKFEDTARRISTYAKQVGRVDKLEVWDFSYWANQYKKKYHNFDESQLSVYLPLDKALEGFFNTAESIFNVRFERNDAQPIHHGDAIAYDVYDNKIGELIGVFYTDMSAREHKDDGAWMIGIQPKSADKPAVVSINMNLSRTENGVQPLLNINQLETLFHEGGHALHGLLGNDTRHDMLQGTGAQGSESVEFYSIFLEKLATQPEVLKSFARHHETGAPITDDLLQAFSKSKNFLAEERVLRLVMNSQRDLAVHSMKPEDYVDTATLHTSTDIKRVAAAYTRPYDLNRFSHLFSEGMSGYASGYYGYLWADNLAQLAVNAYVAAGEGAARQEFLDKLREAYHQGSSISPHEVFAKLLGKPVTPELLASAVLAEMGVENKARGRV